MSNAISSDTLHRPITRRRIVQAAGAALATSLLPGASRGGEASEPFTFVHLTDIHLQPELDAERGFRQCIERVNQLRPQPDFVITGGDLIMDALAVDRARIELQWKLFDACLRDLPMPVYHTIGNHDVGGWSTKKLLKADDYDYGKKRFADHYGRGGTFRSFDHRGRHFVLLDSIGQVADGSGYYGLIDDAQLDWLRRDLERVGKQTPIIVVTHIPLFSVWHLAVEGPTRPHSAGSLVTNAPAVRAVLEPYDVQLVLSGHGHLRERIELTGTTYIQSGAVSGRWWKGRINDEAEAFGVITCRSDGFSYRYEDYGWQAVKA